MDAQSLFRDGVTAIRDQKDLVEGRKLLTQCLRLDPRHEMAWLWLSRTTNDPAKQLQCVQRVLSINPANQQAQTLKQRLEARLNDDLFGATEAVAASSNHAPPAKTVEHVLTADEERRIQTLLDKAQIHLDNQRVEDAIEQWVRVLEIQADHEIALSLAVRHLSRLRQLDDVKELVGNALNAGTQHPSVYLTAIDIAKREKDYHQVDELRQKLARLPQVDENTVIETIDYFLENQQIAAAHNILVDAVEARPKNQKLLLRLAKVEHDLGHQQEAMRYYERVAKLGGRSEAGKAANEMLDQALPELTDAERGSTLLAVREAMGFGILFLTLGWLDSRLNMALMGASRWGGVLLGLLGGYLIVTATSSPQQHFLAKILGGKVPDDPDVDTELPIIPPGVRVALGVIGAALVMVAFALVFSTAISLLGNPTPPPIPPMEEIFTE